MHNIKNMTLCRLRSGKTLLQEGYPRKWILRETTKLWMTQTGKKQQSPYFMPQKAKTILKHFNFHCISFKQHSHAQQSPQKCSQPHPFPSCPRKSQIGTLRIFMQFC